ncbi:A/G-specific adenine glycosylase [Microvirga rosea]|uniref:A/G-specific adenine glycosylase n=1 Tax=Microvirga rosea TaxID=2715425 RepID=UPI001D0B2F89|nr:A/G-specific adenine glycosylase [Microvirga rosea]MCB8820321.1 A/G-specific adenine glycosylase [Microvirga rosea]
MLTPASRVTKPDPADLLTWYDRHRRDLPWRAKPGEAVDPYRVWLSEIMLQQTTVVAVRPFYQRFLEKFPTVSALAEAPVDAVMQAWAGLGYYSRARNLHACAKAVVEKHGGLFPGTEAELLKLPGVGAYTAAAVAAIAFNQPAAAVDGNVERVVSRLFMVEDPLPKAKPLIRTLTQDLVPADRPGDFAQALMDLGATICTPRRPACALCPWMTPCRARAEGLQETFPRKIKKEAGQLRRGAAFVVLRADDSILLRTRPPQGLLGGMAEAPTSIWEPDYEPSRAVLDAPLDARWQRLPGVVRHVFTHFPLELTILFAKVPKGTPAPEDMRWTLRRDLHEEALPGVMKKVIAHALGELPAPAKEAPVKKRAAPRKGSSSS